MNRRMRKPFLFVILVISVTLALIGSAGAQGPVTKGKTGDKGWSALDKVDQLNDTLQKAGFSLQEGTVEYIDLVKECCQGRAPDTLANNPWPNAYVTVRFSPHEDVPAAPAPWAWQIREDEAIVLVGQTPPAAAYFSYQTFVLTTPPYPEHGTALHRLGIALGDTTNIATVNTIGPDRANKPIVYIITGNRETEQRVRAAALKAGYPAAIINVEAISPVIAPLGIGREGSWFYWVHRTAVPVNKDALNEYVKHPPYVALRVTPGEQLAPNPEPVPVLRVRGTGHTEMELYPALKRLRQAILDKYAQTGYDAGQRRELDTKVWSLVTRDGREMILEKPYVGLQRDYQVIGGTRDTNYLATYPNFMLRDGTDEFVIVYGVNHQKTSKATYASVSIYADKDRWFGVKDGTRLSPDFGDSASHFLPGDPDADKLYVLKVARNCHGEEHCLQVNQPDFKDINDQTYTCELDDLDTPENDPSQLDFNTEEMFFIFRSYMEPATNVGPDDNELLYDRAIYFGPYFDTE